jgi:PAS domain S-box-containing protein
MASDEDRDFFPPASSAAQRRAGGPRNGPSTARITPAVLLGLLDALQDGVVLANDEGALVLANRRAEDMFGYAHGELIGYPVETLVPAGLQEAHAGLRARYAREPTARPMGARARLVGLHKDGSTFPLRISLSPVPTATDRFILAVIRDVTDDRPSTDLGDLARAAAANQVHRGRKLLDRVVNSLFHVGLSLDSAIDLPHDIAIQRIADALRRLDDTIRDIRGHVFTDLDQGAPPDSAPANEEGDGDSSPHGA